jgi:hypothetical protein
MIKHNQNGAISAIALSLIFSVVFLVAAVSFGAWAYSSRQDYKNNVDAKIASAVAVAKQQESSAKDKQFAEDEKKPLRTYNGPEAFGSLQIMFPKTWSGQVDDGGSSGSGALSGYFYPGIVPSVSSSNTTTLFALRVQVLNQSYSSVVKGMQSELSQRKNVTITPYALPKLPKVVGIQLSGPIFTNDTGKTGQMVIFPLRSQTLKLWTEGTQFSTDFNNNILPNFTFSP